MARRGRSVTFHGAFTTRAKAERKHKRVARSYIRRRRFRRIGLRYMVLTRRRRR